MIVFNSLRLVEMTKEKRTVQKTKLWRVPLLGVWAGVGGGKEKSAKETEKILRGRRKIKGFTDL